MSKLEHYPLTAAVAAHDLVDAGGTGNLADVVAVIRRHIQAWSQQPGATPPCDGALDELRRFEQLTLVLPAG